jgi:hypothetical protein
MEWVIGAEWAQPLILFGGHPWIFTTLPEMRNNGTIIPDFGKGPEFGFAFARDK